MRRLGVILAIGLSTSAVAGPISKFDGKEPKIRYHSSVSMFDAERCIVDLDDIPVPTKIWQADRPDQVTYLWENPVVMRTSARADIRKDGDGSQITLWDFADRAVKALQACAPASEPQSG